LYFIHQGPSHGDLARTEIQNVLLIAPKATSYPPPGERLVENGP